MELDKFKPYFHESWLNKMSDFLTSDKMTNILNQLGKRKIKNAKIYPEQDKIFRVFKDLSFDNVKIVILNDEPYYRPFVSDGIAFSSNIENYIPEVLENIYKEIDSDILDNKIQSYREANLSWLLEQGVLLLNTSLTVESGMPEVHKKIWKEFTEYVLQLLNKSDPKVIILWGEMEKYIKHFDNSKHLILSNSNNPHYLNKNSDWFGGKYFSKSNKFLKGLYGEENIIEWRSPPF